MTSTPKLPVIQESSKALTRTTIIGPPLLLEGEDPKAYDDLLAQVSGAVKPSDTIEEIWVHDVVYLTWDIRRWRRIKTSFVEQAMPRELKSALSQAFPKGSEEDNISAMSSLDNLIKKWSAGVPSAIRKVEKLMVSANITIHKIVANICLREVGRINYINKMIAEFERRRNATLREIDRRRAAFSQTLRDTVRDIEDAEFTTAATKAIAPADGKKAA